MPELDEFWLELADNATPPSDDGSRKRSLDQVVRDTIVEGLICGWSWLQAELPAPGADPRASLLEQENSGDRDAYFVQWPTECVTDWAEKNGTLLWLRTYECIVPDDDPAAKREDKIHRWTLWDATSWTRYDFLQKKNQQLPGDETSIAPTDVGQHTFGRVPWVRFDVSSPGGATLHIGDVIESLCRQYFNRQNGESFQWTQNYFQQLYEFLAPEMPGVDEPISEAQSDPKRAQRSRAPGKVQVRGERDKAMFVGPDMSSAAEGRLGLQDLRDAILRVTAQMALAQDTSGAMLRRSADSKRQDSVAQEIILGSIGKRGVVLVNSGVQLLSVGRGDTAEDAPRYVGYERFNVTDAEDLINQSVLVESIWIPSATYQIEQKFQVAVTHLGDNASTEVKEKIRAELQQAITQDQLTMTPPGSPGAEIDDEENPDETEPDDDPDDMEA
jgi:hypothetical protein